MDNKTKLFLTLPYVIVNQNVMKRGPECITLLLHFFCFSSGQVPTQVSNIAPHISENIGFALAMPLSHCQTSPTRALSPL